MAAKTRKQTLRPAVVADYREAIQEDPQGEYAVMAREQLVKFGYDVSDLPAYDPSKPIVSYGPGENGKRPVVATYQPGQKIPAFGPADVPAEKQGGQRGDTRTSKPEPMPTPGELRFIERNLEQRELIEVIGGVNLNQVLIERYHAGTITKRQARELGDWLKQCPYKGQAPQTAPMATKATAPTVANPLVDSLRRMLAEATDEATVKQLRAAIDAVEAAAAPQATAAPAAVPAKPVRPATEKQLASVVREGARRDFTDHKVAETVRKAVANEAVSFADASAALDVLFASKFTPRDRKPAAEEGFYVRTETRDGESTRVFYKVQIAHHGSGLPYAKRLNVFPESVQGPDGELVTRVNASWDRAPGVVNELTADQRLSLEEAQAFGKLYGVCCCCATILTDEKSIAAGIGPICASKL